ncbi:MAG: DUF4384 domain-containing protein [Prevotellaceae bacterium]|jgi:hypothetical protein|nr:DUF4384 domain-containing protein [Prevotellaceae bacterium]
MLILILLVWVIFPAVTFAQKTVTVCGEYTYIVPENVTQEQAKQTAIGRAKIEALTEKFNQTLSQQNATIAENSEEKSSVKFIAISGSEVRGEWIEDTKPPEIKIFYEEGMLVVKASVCGKAREIKGAGIDFTAQILRNGTESRFASDNFRHGDDFYLLFKTPVSGYLAVYLMDDRQNVFCLLPYRSDASGKTQVKAGKEYVFFSAKHADNESRAFVDEYTLTSEKSSEQNFLYLIFSPNAFTKANDSQVDSELVLPRELPFEDFQKWLAKNKTKDKDMKVETKSLMIKK